MSSGKKLLYRGKKSLLNPERWGISLEVAKNLPDLLYEEFEGFIDCFATRTWNNHQYAWAYIMGLFAMERNRNFTNISKNVVDVRDDGQRIQHFMSDSPWSADGVYESIQDFIRDSPELGGGFLIFDESAEARKGGAGVSRQRNGRLGKVDSSQVGVEMVYHKEDFNVVIGARMYVCREWFEPEKAGLWKSCDLPENLEFKTKPRLALEMFEEAVARGVPFDVVSCDEVYGHSFAFRKAIAERGKVYLADVPGTTLFYVDCPKLGVPKNVPGKRGRRYKRPRAISRSGPSSARKIAGSSLMRFQRVKVRPCERGVLSYEAASLRGWTVKDGEIMEETLFIRKDSDGSFSYSLTNAPAGAPLKDLALLEGSRYFVERAFEDVKSDLGWDELCAWKYRSWVHHTALVCLALLLAMIVRVRLMGRSCRDPALRAQLEVDVLPPLSVGCVKLLVGASLFYSALDLVEAIRLVIDRQLNRVRSTKCRLNKSMAQLSQKLTPGGT